jgi:hypothetical protein
VATRAAWVLLIHQIPPRPLYLRAKIRQQLSRVGAVPVKKSVYALPDRPDCVEDFQWIAQEVESGGGEAYVCRAEFLGSSVDEQLRKRSRRDRDADFDGLSPELARAAAASPADASALARLRARWEEIRRVDFFDARNGPAVGRKIEEAQMRLARKSRDGSASASASASASTRGSRASHPRLAGKVWVTRPGVKVDRIASAWFVRRFVDPKARFRFDALSRSPRPGEVFFDVAGGDFTHEGERCTLETLVARTGSRDPGVARISEIVHDLDLKDGKFGRLEAPGVAHVIAGIVGSTDDDGERLRAGFALFDQLHRGLSSSPGGAARPVAAVSARGRKRK